MFDRINDQEFCSEFFGQVLVAFNALTKHIADGELSNIEWGDKLITIKNIKNDELDRIIPFFSRFNKIK